MKPRIVCISLILISILLSSCTVLTNIGGKMITPSDVVITETRDVSGFTGIDFSTVGKITISQGSNESLTISGSDNLVPLIKTAVSNGVLRIYTDENINVTGFNSKNVLTFTINVKNLTSLNVSGVGDVQCDTLSTPNLDLTMSGAGKVTMNQLSADSLKVNLSGVGGLDVSGAAPKVTIDISGVGGVNAPDLKVQTANVTISGLGGATVWVTDQLTGNISGAGSVSYYGTPQTSTNTSGLGRFKSLGSK